MNKSLIDFSAVLFIWQSLLLVSIVLWIYCLVDILKNKFEKNDKIVWLLAVMFLLILGSLFYLFIGKNKKLKVD